MPTQTQILFKRSNTSGAVPTTTQLSAGEIAINSYDGKVYFKRSNAAGDAVIEFVTAGNDGKINPLYLPPQRLQQTYVVGSQGAMTALSSAITGDLAVRTDQGKTYILGGTGDYSILGNWVELLFAAAAVNSVDGRTGAVTLTDKYAGISAFASLSQLVDDTIVMTLMGGY